MKLQSEKNTDLRITDLFLRKVKQQNNGELVWKPQTSKISVNNRKKKEKLLGKKCVADKNKVKKRMEEKLNQCYMGPCNENTNLPTLIFIFFLFLFSSLFSFFHFINFPGLHF